MKVPTNYLEWCNLFDEIIRNPRDEEYFDLISHGTISWTSGVAERFVQSASNMIRSRVNAAQDTYQKQMRNARGMNTNIINALGGLAKEYRYVYKLANALPIPADFRDQLVDSVRKQADQTQHSLEDSAKADRTGRLLSTVRSTRVNKLD